MLVLCFLLALIFATPVDALAWDDFANNLATDLAPLITLFGEQVTKQFLSESVGLLDNIIFAVAPLGILTAIVSAIRVQGSPSLRAFIGRAQEASGNAEVELLSSTSETTSELWHEGGIARVFGRPKILEVVRTARIDDGDYAHNNDGDCQAGIKLFNEACIGSASLWVQQNKASDQFDSEGSYESTPNLSFNIGIKKMPKAYKCGVATLGLTLQTGVLIFASLTAYHDPENFLIEEKPAENYGFPFVFSGTLLVSCGMFLCAYIIDKGSSEISYEQRCKKNSTIYWVQPGGQKIGDQIFESFVGLSNHHEYLRSSKRPRGNGKDYVVLWIAVISTIVGFVSQFVGLRAMHSSVIMAQLASTLIMAILRAALRTQRMDPTRNRLESYEMECMKRNMETVNMRNTTRQAPQKPYWFSWIMFNIKKVNGAREKRQPDFAGLRKHVQGHEMDFLAMDLEGIHSLYICIQPPEDQIQGTQRRSNTFIAVLLII
ncbi:hypothetical protein IQ07DRAFT_609934 [Pyrenochaeta sp. DS3sAY3a]|nr:hypothetical protein IQ07DRAFT_609934 [Pyrenochaeta sp. DS3sAY3a]